MQNYSNSTCLIFSGGVGAVAANKACAVVLTGELCIRVSCVYIMIYVVSRTSLAVSPGL